MKVLYAATSTTEPLYVSTSNKTQKVLLWFQDENDWYVYYADDSTSQVFINRIVNKFATSADQLFSVLNFDVVKDDEQFKTYQKWIETNFNYSGLIKGEELDG